MADGQTSSAEDRALDALTRILDTAVSPDMLEVQKIILRRLALSGDLFPSRVPPPLNITQVGGYLNLLDDHPELRAQMLASTLGVAGPNPQLGWEEILPPLFFATRANDRPAGTAQAATPVHLTVRSDFAAALDAALQTIRDHGCTLPVLSPVRALPRVAAGGAPPTDLLVHLGRTLDLLPAAALTNPATDPLAVGEPAGGGGARQVLARQLDTTAPAASSLSAADWSVWTCTASACSQTTVNETYLPIGPVLSVAGWHQGPVAVPSSATQQGTWSRWTNVTGLVAGTSTVGAELTLLYAAGEIAQSTLREQLDWVWDGSAFVRP
jgi:hypothetical protein